MKLTHINLSSRTVSPKNYAAIDMQNARLLLESCSLRHLKTFPEWLL